MAQSVTDPLEKAVLSGAIFAGPDPDGAEPRARGEANEPSDRANTDDELSLNGDSDDGNAFTHPDELQPNRPGPVRTTKGMSHNTGVKGVLADYRNRNTPGYDELGKGSAADAEDGGDDDGSDGEREAREAYRRTRLQEMMKMGSSERRDESRQHSGPSNGDTVGGPRYRAKFGHLREVGQVGFLKAVEEEAGGALVVIHVYTPTLPACNVINHHLSSLARAHPNVNFLRALSSELQFASGSEADVLPTVLVYRNGENVQSLVAFAREFRPAGRQDDDEEEEDDLDQREVERRITKVKLEQVLERHGILESTNSKSAGANYDDGDDDDA